ncbi:MAG TPA: HlyD family type I secretion periplasmic adaptor subunit, partial [Albitalea sp.]|nr:HlyD family type I secretion periplasmic adaptor subunit [Albitalea sp.]
MDHSPVPASGTTHHRLIRAGQALLRVLERVRLQLEPLTRRLFGPDAAGDAAAPAGFRSFEQDADAVMSRSGTQRAQKIVRAAVVILLLLLLWASFAHVEEVTRGEGKVIPSRQLQVVQSLDGGVVSEILVQ